MTNIIPIRDKIYSFGEASYKQRRPYDTDKHHLPLYPLWHKSLTAKETPSSQKNSKKEDKPFWTKRKVAVLVGLCAIIGAVFVLYKLKNIDLNTTQKNIDPNTANCIENWEYDESGGIRGRGTCCAKEDPASSAECQATKQEFREKILAENPSATFSYRIQEYFNELSPITQEIETGLRNLAQMDDTDPGKGDLMKNLANKLFVDLPNYCNSYSLPPDMEQYRSKLCAKEIDYLYERNPNLRSEKILLELWRKFGLLSHPDKGGNMEVFARGASVSECLKHLNKGNPSCRWMELKPIGDFKPEPYENFKPEP